MVAFAFEPLRKKSTRKLPWCQSWRKVGLLIGNHAATRSEGSAAPAAEHARIGRLDGIRTVAIAMVVAAHLGLWGNGWMGFRSSSSLRLADHPNSAARPRCGLVLEAFLHQTSDSHPSSTCRCVDPRGFIFPYCVAEARPLLPVFWREYRRGAASRRVRRPGCSVVTGCGRAVLSPLAVCNRFLSRRHLIQFLVALSDSEPIPARAFTPVFNSIWPIYFLTPFQLDGLAAGSLLAVLLKDAATTEAATPLVRQSRTSNCCSLCRIGREFRPSTWGKPPSRSILWATPSFSLAGGKSDHVCSLQPQVNRQ